MLKSMSATSSIRAQPREPTQKSWPSSGRMAETSVQSSSATHVRPKVASSAQRPWRIVPSFSSFAFDGDADSDPAASATLGAGRANCCGGGAGCLGAGAGGLGAGADGLGAGAGSLCAGAGFSGAFSAGSSSNASGNSGRIGPSFSPSLQSVPNNSSARSASDPWLDGELLLLLLPLPPAVVPSALALELLSESLSDSAPASGFPSPAKSSARQPGSGLLRTVVLRLPRPCNPQSLSVTSWQFRDSATRQRAKRSAAGAPSTCSATTFLLQASLSNPV
mmetsp:Transcript_102956/g.307545  ORF Transcript_102956/g.307545 Transcript_102956/m.307545 type:complete len:278 (+) Transcript_102956:747-1580(+)